MGVARIPCPLRWADMDAFGIVNNVVYARYLEQARVELLAGSAAGAGLPDLQRIVVARVEIDYRRPLTWRPGGVEVALWTEDVGTSAFTVGYEVRDESAVYAQARTVLVAFDFQAQRPRRLTGAERDYLAGLRAEPGAG